MPPPVMRLVRGCIAQRGVAVVLWNPCATVVPCWCAAPNVVPWSSMHGFPGNSCQGVPISKLLQCD